MPSVGIYFRDYHVFSRFITELFPKIQSFFISCSTFSVSVLQIYSNAESYEKSIEETFACLIKIPFQ